MAIGDDIVPPIPAVGTSGTSYASQLVAFLQEVKSRLEAPVPLTSILVSLLDMANNAIANLQYASFYEQDDAPTTPIGSLQNYQGNLWWVSDAGAAQLTSGNSLNAASIGGIDGDYGGVNPASFRFSDADEAYYAYDDFGALEWAHMGARTFDVYGDIDSTTRVRVSAASGTDNYTITFADALPASQVLVQMEADGDLVYSNTLPTNTNITLAGTGKIVHGTYSMGQPIGLDWAQVSSGTLSYVGGDDSKPGFTLSIGGLVYVPIFGLDSTKTVTGFQVFNAAAPAAAATYTLVKSVLGSFATTGITVTSNGASPSASGSQALVSGIPLWLEIGAGASTVSPVYVIINYTSAA